MATVAFVLRESNATRKNVMMEEHQGSTKVVALSPTPLKLRYLTPYGVGLTATTFVDPWWKEK